MKALLISIYLVAFSIDPFTIAKINKIKSQAREAYTSGDYKTAVAKYTFLIDSMKVNEDEIALNLANSYFQLKDTANAFTTYQALTGSTKNIVRSKAQHQLGVMNYQRGKLEEALNNFKLALKASSQNSDARYNYEMLKKKLDEEQKKQDKQDQKDKDKKLEPSEFAKKLKLQADALAAQFKFSEAHSLMINGAKKDASVMHYEDFIKRLADVVNINKPK